VRPTITITKVSLAETGAFSFIGTNGYPGQTITTTTSGAPVSASPVALTTAGVATTITESTPPAGTSVSASCTGIGTGTATASGNSVTLNAAATASGNHIACTFTNSKRPTLTITKISVGATGSFAFSGTNGYPGQTLTTSTSGTPVTGAPLMLTVPGVATTITESTLGVNGYSVAATCTGLGTGTATLVGNALTLSAAATAAGNNIACTFTNTSTADQPTVTVIDDLTDVLDDATFDSVSSNAGKVGNEIVWNGPLPVTTTPVVVTYTVTVGNPDPGNGTLSTQLNDVTTGGSCPAAATGCTTSNPITANPVPVLLSGGQHPLGTTTGLAFTGVDSQLLLITAGLLLGVGGLFLLISLRRRRRI